MSLLQDGEQRSTALIRCLACLRSGAVHLCDGVGIDADPLHTNRTPSVRSAKHNERAKLAERLERPNAQSEVDNFLSRSMKQVVAAILFFIAVGAGCLAYARNASLHDQMRVVPKQTEDIREAQPTSIPQQKDCEEKARQQFHRDGLDNRPYTYRFIAHYNGRLRNCFVEIASISRDSFGHSVVTRSLGDVRGRDYADYAIVEEGGGKQSRAWRHFCSIILSSGEEMDCYSSDEFNAAVENYMTR